MENWDPGPYGPTLDLRATFPTERVVLFVAHHPTAITRLLDVAPIIEEDHRVQTVWTVPSGGASTRAALDFLWRIGARTVPWAIAKATRFDVAIAAALGSLEQVNAPVIALDHGHGPAKMVRRIGGADRGPDAPRELYGATPSTLTSAGRVVPALIGVAHERSRALIAQAVPDAAAVTRIVGDPVFDRLQASLERRDDYRLALGAGTGRRLVVVSSTWGRRSLYGTDPELPRRVVAELPGDRYRVIALQHPAIGGFHGDRQTLAWLAPARRAGLGLLPAEQGWHAALIAADVMIADHSSVTVYGASVGCPVVLGAFPDDELMPGSLPTLVADNAPRLRTEVALERQIDSAIENHDPCLAGRYAAALTSAPGASAGLLRAAAYRLMSLPEPPGPAVVAQAPLPRLVRNASTASLPARSPFDSTSGVPCRP
ncbi:hypothetical protein [Nocardiopsis ansamitocini]|uniref:Uncharacterized protein n=1 Tax=Nocardiopsis ansamitocini TaxID=1670832 RepID=A0A9W6UG99_9ACTN|nr:hypothetical protein [Nocardiopsis ansamitocini]GLU46966.1 hypothetical protein Nans01_13170 [Nocardiopsis ansamitocini]